MKKISSSKTCDKEAIENSPTKVIFVRNFPKTGDESDLKTLASPFGTVTQTVLMGKFALIEMATIEEATRVIENYSDKNTMLRGQQIFFGYSTKSRVEPEKGKVKGAKRKQPEASGIGTKPEDSENWCSPTEECKKRRKKKKKCSTKNKRRKQSSF